MVVTRLHTAVALTWLMVFGLLAGCSDDSDRAGRQTPTVAFELRDMQGQLLRFPRDVANNVVLVAFWADWCPACKQELRHFEQLHRRHKERGLSVLAINIAQDRQTAAAFIQDLDLGYDVLLDSDGQVASAHNISLLPAALVFDQRAVLQTRVLGETSYETFEQLVLGLLPE